MKVIQIERVIYRLVFKQIKVEIWREIAGIQNRSPRHSEIMVFIDEKLHSYEFK